MNLTVKNIRARGVQAPLKRPPRSASGEIPNAPLVLIDLQTNEGITGSCYLFAFMGSMLKPTIAMVEAMAEMITGDALAPFEIEAKLRKRMTLQCTTTRRTAWFCSSGGLRDCLCH